MKTVLITGANGFVASYVIRNLLQKSYAVIATGKGPSRVPFSDSKLVYETLDFTDEKAVSSVFQKHKPDIVVHTGAMSKPDECEQNRNAAFQTNVRGTEFLLQAASAHQSYFLFVSTDFVFEGASLHYRESDALGPVNYYGETKKLAEAAVQKYQHDWSIVRTILVYGKPISGRQNLLTMVASALQKNETLKIFSDQTRTPTYVEDLAYALATMIDKESTGIFHISGEDVITPYHIARAVAKHLCLDEQKIEEATTATFKQPAARPPITGFDLTKAAKALSYKPTSFLEGLKKTFEA